MSYYGKQTNLIEYIYDIHFNNKLFMKILTDNKA